MIEIYGSYVTQTKVVILLIKILLMVSISRQTFIHVETVWDA